MLWKSRRTRLLEELVHEQRNTSTATLELAKALQGFASSGESLHQSVDTLQEILELMKSEPFAALKSWIVQTEQMLKRAERLEKRYQERERELLARWKAQVEDKDRSLIERVAGL